PGGCAVTLRRAPGRGSPSSLRMNGFHSGYAANPASTLQTAAGEAAMSIAVSMRRTLGDLETAPDGEPGLGLGLDLVDRDAVGELDQRDTALARLVDVEHAQLADHHVDDAAAGERQRALVQELRLTVLGDVLHGDDHLLHAGDQVHGAA